MLHQAARSKEHTMYHGIINVYKEPGYTSHDVVARLRGILKQKKIGHTGTLDPAAEGVLPVCLGAGTRLCDMLTDRSKTYQAVMLLGCETDTQDTTGTILAEDREGAMSLAEEQVNEAVMGFKGDYARYLPCTPRLRWTERSCMSWQGRERKWNAGQGGSDSGHKGKQDRTAQGLDGGHLFQRHLHTYPVP